MGSIIDQVEGKGPQQAERCPFCGRENARANLCRHVRWAFERGDALAFAKYALETSPYVRGRGHKPAEIPQAWWLSHADWIMNQIDYRLHIGESYLFGELAELDVLAREVWKLFQPDYARSR